MSGVEIAGAVITGLGLIKNAFEVLQSIQDKRVEMALEPDTVRELKGHIVVVKTRLQPFEGRRLHKDSDQQTIINLRKFLDVTEARLQKYRGPSFFRLLKRVVIGSRWPVFLTKSLAAVAHCEAMMKDVQVQMDISGRVRLPAVQVQSPAFAVAKAALLATSSDLQRPRGLPQVLLLNGMHGMGKSTLALQLALDLEGSEEFKSGGVYYLPVDTAPLPADAAINIRRQQEDAVIVRLQQSLLVQLGYGSAAGKCNDTDSLREQLNEMFKGELANRRHLLVVDGLWSQRMIEAFQIDSMKGAILATVSYWDDASGLTSVADAEAAWAGDELGVRQVHLQSDGDSRSTAQALLREYVSLNTQEKKDLATEVLDRCDGNLQAVALIGRDLKSRAEDAWRVVIDDFKARAMGSAMPTGSEQALSAAIAISIKDMHNSPNLDIHTAAHALGLLQHVRAQVRLPIRLLELLMRVCVQAEDAPTYIKPKDDARMLLQHLVDYNIMCKEVGLAGRELYFSNYLVGEVLKTDLPDEMQIPLPATVQPNLDNRANHLAVLLLGFGTEPAVQWARQRLQLAAQFVMPAAMQVSTVAKLREWAFSSSNDFNQSNGMLTWRLGQVLFEAGLYEPALRLHITAREQAARQADKASKGIVARITSSIAALMIEQGDLQGALQYAVDAPKWLRAAGASADLVMEASENHAVLLVLMAEAADTADAAPAEGSLQEAAATFKKAATHFKEAAETARRSLEAFYKSNAAGDLGSEKVLKLQCEVLGYENSELISRNNLGYVLARQSKFTEAADVFKAAHDDAVLRLPPNDHTTAIILDSMAFLADREHNNEESKNLYRKALDMKTAVLGPQHPDTLATKQRLERVSRSG